MNKKKKIRQKHQPDPGYQVEEANSSDEEENAPETTKFCPHITKSLSIMSMKKVFKGKITFGQCQVCSKTALKSPLKDPLNLEELDDSKDIETDTSSWLCLQCGHQGCSQNSEHKHAKLHYNTPHSDSHALVLNTEVWSIWCYKCDDEVGADTTRHLADCVEFVKKQAAILSKSKLGSSTSSSCFGIKGQTESVEIKGVLDDVPPKTINSEKYDANIDILSPPFKDNKKKLNGMVVSAPQIQVKGLINLVNTCFFNAVLQNLSQIPCCLSALENHCNSETLWEVLVPSELQKDTEETSVSIPLLPCGHLTRALINLLKEMNSTSRDKKGTINPNQLFKQVCEIAPQFKNQQQQDSHELLRCLLDGVRTEEVKRQKRGILKLFGLTEKVNPESVDEEVKTKLKAYGKNASHTIVDRVFGGQLVSTVFCEECLMSSQVFESFMDLSLPVSEEKKIRPGLQKRQSSEDTVDCFGRVPVTRRNNNDTPIVSKYQEKKQKRQNKKEAKKQAKAEKNSKKSLPTSPTTDSSSKSEENNEDENSEADVNDADIEDNNDDTTSQESLITSKSPRSTTSGGDDIDSVLPRTLINNSSSQLLHPNAALVEATEDKLSAALTQLTIHPCEKSESKDSLLEPTEELLLDGSSSPISPPPPLTNGASSTSASTVNAPEVVGKENYLGSTDSGLGHGEAEPIPSLTNGCLNSTFTTTPTKNLKKEWQSKSWTSMAPRYLAASHEISVLSCLHLFTLPELMMGKNKFGCENCSKIKAEKEGLDENKHPMVYTNATKQLLIISPPAVLTLHLKRFQQSGMSLTKVNRFVEFPLVLDLAPFCSSIAVGLPHMRTGQDKILYSLCGVVEHSGKLSGGHYTAFVRVKNPAKDDGKSLLSFLNDTPVGQLEIDSLLEEFMRKGKFAVYDHKSNEDGLNNNNSNEGPSSGGTSLGKWYHVSDTHVSEVTETAVLRCQAYLLFYERIF